MDAKKVHILFKVMARLLNVQEIRSVFILGMVTKIAVYK